MADQPTPAGDLAKVLKQFTYGRYIITTRQDGDDLATREADYLAAGAVSWAMQTSFSPPLLAIAIDKHSNLQETIHRSGVFALHVLGSQDEPLLQRFGKAGKAGKAVSSEEIAGIDFHTSEKTGAPILAKGLAWLDCRVTDTLDGAGDHVIFVGEVVDAHCVRPGQPLHEWMTDHHYAGLASPK